MDKINEDIVSIISTIEALKSKSRFHKMIVFSRDHIKITYIENDDCEEGGNLQILRIHDGLKNFDVELYGTAGGFWINDLEKYGNTEGFQQNVSLKKSNENPVLINKKSISLQKLKGELKELLNSIDLLEKYNQ